MGSKKKIMGRLTKNDIRLMQYLAKYGFLTIKQLSLLSQRNSQSIGRRRRFLESEGHITRFDRGGKQENLIFLTKTGIQLLKTKKLLPESVDQVTEKTILTMAVEHDLLLNWFRIYLDHLQIKVQEIESKFVKIDSRKMSDKNFETSIFIPKFQSEESNQYQLIPDGIFILYEKKSKKYLLFFLEVDMGSEALKTSQKNNNTIENKIIKYQILFQKYIYKNYEQFFQAKFNGFRLLFLAKSTERLKGLWHTARQMPPSSFVWLTDTDSLFSKGLHSEIWLKGSEAYESRYSILGRLSEDVDE